MMLLRENSLSPCKRICILSENKKLCKTCYRTINEISNWGSYNRKQKIEILKKIDMRKNSAKKIFKAV